MELYLIPKKKLNSRNSIMLKRNGLKYKVLDCTKSMLMVLQFIQTLLKRFGSWNQNVRKIQLEPLKLKNLRIDIMNTQISAMMTDEAIAKAQADFLSKVYAWMFGGLLITALIAWYVFDSQLYISIINSGLMFPLFIGELALVFILSARINKISRNSAAIMFLSYAALNGLTFAVIL
ncbi:MAG TPA: hypothetical protein EYP22_11290, partial [Methanosarcinales archaeon]|nr:hypothetical protein [Methanosarcinales archaeon]